MGTSISQMGIKQQDDDQSKTMADWIHEKYPQYNQRCYEVESVASIARSRCSKRIPCLCRERKILGH